MGLSLSQIQILLALIVHANQRPSRSTLGRWLEVWCTRAGHVLRVLDGACRELVLTLCIDEIFLGRRPVLVGVEPHSMAWVIGQKAEDCSGQRWYEFLRDWDHLEYAVADAGSGLRKGLSLIQEARAPEADARELEVGLDVFHINKDLRRTVRASSVVECMNSVIRMHQARHRRLTQPLLDLKRLYWNCRPFREGKRREPFWWACWTARQTLTKSASRSRMPRRCSSQKSVIGRPRTSSMTK
jgi:hypothetical protein